MEPGSEQIEIVPLRGVCFTANINNLLESQPGNLLIEDIDLTDLFTEGRLDCTITLRHPFPGFDMFNGFDVRGVFMHNGASALNYDGLTYSGGPDAGENEGMLLNPDGYTRWFNQPEFDGDGLPLLEYWPGKLSSLPEPTATLNPYKIFTNGLDEEEDFYEWITSSGNADDRGIFRAGQQNSRRYEMQFPIIDDAPMVNFQYAVITTWEQGDPGLTGDPGTYEPDDFPTSANCEEAFFLNVSTDDSNLYCDGSGSGNLGGTFTADIEVFDWQGGSVGELGVVNEIESIMIEGDFVPGGSHEFTQAELAMVAAPGTQNSSVFQIEIIDCTPQASGEADFWVIVESAGLNGESYGQGFPTEYPDGARRAAFKHGMVAVAATPYNTPPTVTGIEDDIEGPGDYKNPVNTNNTSVTYQAIFTDPDTDQTHTFTWWITGDGESPDDLYLVTMPLDWSTYTPGEFDIYVEVDDGFESTLGGPYDITLELYDGGWAVTWGGVENDYGEAIAVSSEGDIYVTGNFQGTADFDPGNGVVERTALGDWDAFLCKFNSLGELQWVGTWGDNTWPGTLDCIGAAVSSDGYIYVVGPFTGIVDFDPGSGVEEHTVVGSNDCYLSKFDSSGNFQWAKTWGGINSDMAKDVNLTPTGDVYVSGHFSGSADFDPGVDVVTYTSNGSCDTYLSKLTSSGDFIWARTWGGTSNDFNMSVAADSAGNAYTVGYFDSAADFDPSSGEHWLYPNGGLDAYLAKFLPNGDFDWALNWGGSGSDAGQGVIVYQPDDSVYVTGQFHGTVDFNPWGGGDYHYSVAGSCDAYLCKFDSSGGFIWARTWGGTDTDNPWGSRSINLSPNGDPCVTGYFISINADFDPGSGVDLHSSYGGCDIFLIKLDQYGDYCWAHTWGDPGWADNGSGVAVSLSGCIYVTGNFDGTVDFDPSDEDEDWHTAAGRDAFLSRFLPNGEW